MTRNATITLRASKLEMGLLKKLSKRQGVTPSEYLRDLLRNAARQNGLLPELNTDDTDDTDTPTVDAARLCREAVAV